MMKSKYEAFKNQDLRISYSGKVLFFLGALLIIGFSNGQNEDVHYQSPSCLKKSTCAGITSVGISENRTCQCDEQCFKYGDCCPDSEYFTPSVLSACVEVGDWNIRNRKYIGSYYMVETCPPYWTEVITRQKCEQYLETIKEEPLSGNPITSAATNITYANHYCARCNNDLHMTTMIPWTLKVYCSQGVESIPDIDSVLYNSTLRHDGKIIPGFSPEHHSCNLYLWRPRKLLRTCQKIMIDFCPEQWSNDTVRTLCETYTSIVYYKMNKAYRNPYCAFCNKRKEDHLYCWTYEVVVETAFALLFDSLDDSSVGVGRTRICPNENEAFDINARKCRNIILSIAGCQAHGKCTLSNCSKFILDPDEYSINDDFTLTDLITRKIYKKEEFNRTEDGRVEICAEYVVSREKFTDSMQYVTFFGLGVSVLSLILHLLAFSVNPALRNLSGKNLASLCVALLLAYISFIIGQLVEVGGLTCRTSAVITYYGFLASFTWLLMLAYDVWKTLRLSTVNLRVVSREKRWRAFCIYSIISWIILPGILVCAAVIVQFKAETLKYWPGFGAHNCWFGNRTALLIFFVIPIGIVMILNVAFYSSSAYMICTTSMSPSNKSTDETRNYKLFARLAVMMGLTWITGFIADYMNMEAIWYIFILLNTFQGLFIFIAFTLTRRVRNGIISQVSGDSGTKTGTNETKISWWSWKGKRAIRTRTTC